MNSAQFNYHSFEGGMQQLATQYVLINDKEAAQIIGMSAAAIRLILENNREQTLDVHLCVEGAYHVVHEVSRKQFTGILVSLDVAFPRGEYRKKLINVTRDQLALLYDHVMHSPSLQQMQWQLLS